MNKITTVQINEKLRVSAYYDEVLEDPRDWNTYVSIHPLKRNGMYIPPNPGDNTNEYEIDEIYSHNDNYETAIKKHFTRLNTLCEIVNLNCDRSWIGEFVFYIEPEKINEIGKGHEQQYLDVTIKEYKQYASGEVYTVAIEKLETWTNTKGDTKETWETEDSLCDIYENVYDDDTLLLIASEYFGIEKTT